MKVLFVAAEGEPFVKTGGLADVIGSLPQELRRAGIDARVLLPNYSKIPHHYREAMQGRTSFDVPVAWRQQYAGLLELEQQGVPHYFIDNEYYFRRDSVYGQPDDAERYAYFCRAALEALPHLDWKPDIIHCHDWHTGPLPLFLHAHYAGHAFYRGIMTVFTIHNLAYQGVFPQECLGNVLGLGDAYFTTDKVEFHGCVNYLKSGVVYSDLVTTVSETYASEIQTPHYGEGLDRLLWARRDDLAGILNGIDTSSYDPLTDPHLDVNYRSTQAKKQENKVLLQERLGLPRSTGIPMIGIISRLVSQKGFDLILHVLDEILAMDVQIVLLGNGDAHYERKFREAQERHPDKMRALIQFSDSEARRIYAASDLFLMPSLFEPCGLSQLIALRYLSVPIVRETGGLRDTIKSYNEETGEGNGFSFTNINAHDMLYTISRALRFYREKDVWTRILKNVEKSDYSWHRSARQYRSRYEQLIAEGEDVHVR